MAKKYTHHVSAPFVGYFTASFESDNEHPDEDDIACAVSEQIERLDVKGDVEIGEWEVLGRIVQGNICFASVWEASVEETEVNE